MLRDAENSKSLKFQGPTALAMDVRLQKPSSFCTL
jgi:hypothetical protein